MDLEIEKIEPLMRMRSLYHSLRKSEQKVVDYIETHLNEIIYLSIGNFAEKCNVSEASIIRLCKAMGYGGFQELKINLAKTMIEPMKYIHEELEENDNITSVIQKVMFADMKAIEDTLKVLDVAEVEKAINALSNARKIEFYGLGGSGVVALDGQHKFFKLGIPCIAYSDPHMQVMSASMLGEGDVAIGISHSGSTKDIVDSLHTAANSGATTICITSSLKSPVTKVSSIKLIISAKELEYRTEPMASRIAKLAVIDVLSVGVALKRKETFIGNLERARKSLISKRY